MIDLLKKLCSEDGTSGNEDNIRSCITALLDKYNCEYKIDALGNIIGKKHGQAGSSKIMVAAHMDEVAMIITFINDDGTLKFGTVGGISAESLIGKKIRINGINGVIGSRAVHNMSKAEKDSAPDMDLLYIDIGANDKAQACAHINLGDCAYFDSDCFDFGEDMLIGKAIDDRAGCAALLTLIKNSGDIGFDFAFTVQEEVGARGAAAAAYSIKPDIAVVLESTTASDIPSASGADRVCEINKGAVIAFMDRSTVYDKQLFELAKTVSLQNQIPCQIKSRIAGGNDCGAIHKAVGGIRCIAISVPCRYLHSPVCVASKHDIQNVYDLTLAILKHLTNN